MTRHATSLLVSAGAHASTVLQGQEAAVTLDELAEADAEALF